MYNIILHKDAENILAYTKKKLSNDFLILREKLTEIEDKGVDSTQVKKIGRIRKIMIFRKRVGRWRILFSVNNEKIIDIWIIDVEKDKKKDYDLWKKKIEMKI